MSFPISEITFNRSPLERTLYFEQPSKKQNEKGKKNEKIRILNYSTELFCI